MKAYPYRTPANTYNVLEATSFEDAKAYLSEMSGPSTEMFEVDMTENELMTAQCLPKLTFWELLGDHKLTII